MGFEHEPDTVWKAQELYCVDRLSFARVAEIVGVSATTLKAWADKYGWRAKREEVAQAESDIRVGTIKGRKVALERLLQAADGKEASQMAFAVASLESLALKQAELAASGKLARAGAQAAGAFVPRLDSREDMLTALRKAVENRLAVMLTSAEGVNLAGVKDVLACMELLNRYAPSEDREDAPVALSAENAKALREVLGL